MNGFCTLKKMLNANENHHHPLRNIRPIPEPALEMLSDLQKKLEESPKLLSSTMHSFWVPEKSSLHLSPNTISAGPTALR